MKAYGMNAVIEFIQNYSDIIESVKVTKVVTNGFNEMEGMNYLANIKVVTSDKYHNKLIRLITNTTYTCELEESFEYDNKMNYLDYLKGALTEYLNLCLS